MFHIELIFGYSGKPNEADVSNGVYSLLASMLNSGQVLDTDWPIAYTVSDCRAVVSCPEATSLHPRHANQYVRESLSALRAHGLRRPKLRLLGRGVESPAADRCKRASWYILMTNFHDCESPLICGEHYLPVPLYRVPPTYQADPSYWDIRCWQRQWKCCDGLQVACGAGERFATRQISDVRSPLSATGCDLCRRIEKLSGVLTYYYLYRGEGRSAAAERKRVCPSCGRKWLLDKPLHRVIDFKCDPCRLLSNIAWSVRG